MNYTQNYFGRGSPLCLSLLFVLIFSAWLRTDQLLCFKNYIIRTKSGGTWFTVSRKTATIVEKTTLLEISEVENSISKLGGSVLLGGNLSVLQIKIEI